MSFKDLYGLSKAKRLREDPGEVVQHVRTVNVGVTLADVYKGIQTILNESPHFRLDVESLTHVFELNGTCVARLFVQRQGSLGKWSLYLHDEHVAESPGDLNFRPDHLGSIYYSSDPLSDQANAWIAFPKSSSKHAPGIYMNRPTASQMDALFRHYEMVEGSLGYCMLQIRNVQVEHLPLLRNLLSRLNQLNLLSRMIYSISSLEEGAGLILKKKTHTIDTGTSYLDLDDPHADFYLWLLYEIVQQVKRVIVYSTSATALEDFVGKMTQTGTTLIGYILDRMDNVSSVSSGRAVYGPRFKIVQLPDYVEITGDFAAGYRVRGLIEASMWRDKPSAPEDIYSLPTVSIRSAGPMQDAKRNMGRVDNYWPFDCSALHICMPVKDIPLGYLNKLLADLTAKKHQLSYLAFSAFDVRYDYDFLHEVVLLWVQNMGLIKRIRFGTFLEVREHFWGTDEDSIRVFHFLQDKLQFKVDTGDRAEHVMTVDAILESFITLLRRTVGKVKRISLASRVYTETTIAEFAGQFVRHRSTHETQTRGAIEQLRLVVEKVGNCRLLGLNPANVVY
jgi:hypothetical protein